MTRTQYRAALKKLGISVVGAAPIFDISRRQAQRIAGGEIEVPILIAKVIDLLLAEKITLEDLR